MEKEIVMYSRSTYCSFVALARDLLARYQIPYREIDIYPDRIYADRVKDWTGHLSVPTLIIALPEEDLPLEPPTPLEPGQSVRGVDRGSMITEPNNKQLEDWLHAHGFLGKPYKR